MSLDVLTRDRMLRMAGVLPVTDLRALEDDLEFRLGVVEERRRPYVGQKYKHGWIPVAGVPVELLTPEEADRDYGDELDRVEFDGGAAIVARSEGALTVESDGGGMAQVLAAPTPDEALGWADYIDAGLDLGVGESTTQGDLTVVRTADGLSLRWPEGDEDSDPEDYDGVELAEEDVAGFTQGLRDMAYVTEDNQAVPDEDDDAEAQDAAQLRHRTLQLLGVEVRAVPRDGDSDGFYSPRKGMPDKTPVPGAAVKVGGKQSRGTGEVVSALRGWAKAGGGDADPLAGFTQPKLKKAAEELGLNPPKGMRLVPLKGMLMAHAQGGAFDDMGDGPSPTPAKKAAPKPSRGADMGSTPDIDALLKKLPKDGPAARRFVEEVLSGNATEGGVRVSRPASQARMLRGMAGAHRSSADSAYRAVPRPETLRALNRAKRDAETMEAIADLVSPLPSRSKAPFVPDEASAHLSQLTTREEAKAYLDGLKLTGPQLNELAFVTGTSLVGVSRKDQFADRIIEHTVGFRQNSRNIRKGVWTDHSGDSGPLAKATARTSGAATGRHPLGKGAATTTVDDEHGRRVMADTSRKIAAIDAERKREKAVKAAASFDASSTAAVLNTATTREQARAALAGLTGDQLRQVADKVGMPGAKSMRKADLAAQLEHFTVGARLSFDAHADSTKGSFEGIGRRGGGASAPSASPQAVATAAIDENAPLRGDPEGDNMRMHGDSVTMNLAQAYARAGRNGSANRMMDLRRRATTSGADGITPQAVVDELKALHEQEQDPRFKAQIAQAIEAVDAPARPLPDLPDSTPPLARQLIAELNAIPYARKRKGERTGAGQIQEASLVEQVAEAFRDAAAGRRDEMGRGPADRIRSILRDRTHEINEAAFRLWAMAEQLGFGPSTSPLSKELRDWERGAGPKA